MNSTVGGGMEKVKEASPRKTKADEMLGRFVWHELATTDPDAAQKYYKKVIGWGTAPFPDADPDEPYVFWVTDETPRGGLLELPETARKSGAPPHWLTYVAVADADKAVEKAKSLGAKVHYGPETIPGAGRFAVLMDPQGGAFAVIKGEGKPTTPAAEPGPGEFHWHELTTTDPKAAWAFYSELFGWKKTDAMDMGDGEVYQMFGVGDGESVGGISRKEGTRPSWLPYVIVNDVDTVAGRIKAMGGKVILEPMEVPGGDWIAVGSDPQGAVLGVHQRPKK
jgi:predicted enzyme related to lactoylglutathione lyase